MIFEVQILGANSANFAYGRHQTAQIVNHNETLFLVDCGEATQIQMLRYKVKLMRIAHIFISHLHGDHYLGLVGLMQTMQLQGRKDPLHIYGPPGLDEIITVQLRWSDTRLNFPATFHCVEEGPSRLVLDTEHVEVYSIPLQHRVVCNGYLFKEKPHKRRIIPHAVERFGLHPGQIVALRKGQMIVEEDGRIIATPDEATLPPPSQRSYAFCSDTIYDESILPLIEGIDLLYHEATFTHDMVERAAQTFHTTALQAGHLALRAGVGRLIIGHFSSRYRDPEVLAEEARTIFADTSAAAEGEKYAITFQNQEPELESNLY